MICFERVTPAAHREDCEVWGGESNQSGVESSGLILKAWPSRQDLGAGQTCRFSGPASKLLSLLARAGHLRFVKPCRWF